ncbi:hypothetical protein, partial [Caballeronia sp. BR00000012568055]|uniref:hypothetical protein n=1 Tax=Caballeronia sp. BR00000012568055 TaxID=2918761 RepID=UPI0023F68174
MAFAFPFMRKGTQGSNAAVKFNDEHEIYQLLAAHEPSGSYLLSSKGLWHGGIHITEAGVGSQLDMNQGVRCIADGHVIAYRLNRTYLVSEIAASNEHPAVQAPYSTGFALVRHTMEFPKGTTLTFYSLYMHLLAFSDYQQDAAKTRPAYWSGSSRYKVTDHAKDVPATGHGGQAADASQKGLRVRASVTRGHASHQSTGILPNGATVSIGERQGHWGKITDTHGAQLYPPQAGAAPPGTVVGGWIFLGNEQGLPLVEEVMPDDAFDHVVVTLTESNPQGIAIKAGDLVGHFGTYTSLNLLPSSANPSVPSTRMAHIEVFCDDSIKSFIDQNRAWVSAHSHDPNAWKALGLSAEPTLLRVDRNAKLYRAAEHEGADAPKTGVVQRWSLGELARDPNSRHAETTADQSGRKMNWWRVKSADAHLQPVEGWVREEQVAGGTVTREFGQKWVDFPAPIEDPHDPTHTMFATTKAWVDYAGTANEPDIKAEAKLSPLMKSVYRALYPEGDGQLAADQLCQAFEGSAGGYPWMMLTASRLIVKHESEWANPEKWKQLYTEIEQVAGPKPQYVKEQERIEKLVWWDEVKAKVPGFPEPSVFHIHPIGLVGNFVTSSVCACGCCYSSSFKVTRMGSTYGPVYWGSRRLSSASV